MGGVDQVGDSCGVTLTWVAGACVGGDVLTIAEGL